MRHTAYICLALLAAWVLSAAARAQTAPGPTLLPPPPIEQGSAIDSESAPWHPPAHVSTPPAANANITPDLQTIEELPNPTEEPLPLPANNGSVFQDDPANVGAELELSESPTWYEPTYWLGPAPWDTGIELGLNGSSGTSETLSIRTGGYVKRESRFSKLDLSGYYNRTTDSGVATQNNAQVDVRNDWLLDEQSPWTLYGTTNLFYDEFQAFDLQLSGNAGVGYRFVHEPGLDLMARFGAGTSREVGGPDDRWVPESLIGFEYGQQLSATQKFYGKLDYFPEWEEVGEYRMVADVGWEIELVQPSNLSLKISATDRYDSTPNGADPHLLNYSVLLLLKL
jgi:hypothetical protein